MDFEQLKIDLQRISGKCEMQSGETMVQVLERLDSSAQSDSTPPQLKHYLVQRSYVKALDCIDDPSAPHQV
ncbi:MAG: hypothetical protein VXZ83_05380 [Verrucomicrobiota bacterium]|nr:hypothetical protein [Verrucomicrobiota bacterium]